MEISGIHILAFGDSIGRGVIFDEAAEHYQPSENAFLPRLERQDGMTVSNFTRYGYTVEKGSSMLEKQKGTIAGSDLVLLEFGGNDCDFDWAAIAENPDGNFQPKTPLDTFRSVYERMVREVLAIGARPLLLNLPPIEPNRYFHHVSRGVCGENILSWLGGDVSYIYRWHEMYSITATAIAQTLGVPVIDIRSPFLAKKNYGDNLCADGIHPNEKGQFLIYQAVREHLISL